MPLVHHAGDIVLAERGFINYNKCIANVLNPTVYLYRVQIGQFSQFLESIFVIFIACHETSCCSVPQLNTGDHLVCAVVP